MDMGSLQSRLGNMSKAELIRYVQRKVLRGGTKSAAENRELFAAQVRKAKLRYRGTTPAKFALGSESFKKFHERFRSYALTSGWNGTQQVAAMLMFLDGEAANVFNRWIEEGRFAKMDADLMWRLLQKHFCDPSEERQIARREITNRVQRKDETVMAYEQVFVEMANRADLSQEERVAQWTKNITPHVADACLLYVAQQDRTFGDVARYARRVDRITPDMRTPQAALNRTAYASSTSTNNRSGTLPAEQTLSIQAITETVRKQLTQEMASKQHLEDTARQLKRELSTLQVLQVQQDRLLVPR